MTNKAGKTRPSRRAPVNLHNRLARAIGERILSGEFEPGSLLPNEAAWGKAFKASRTAVREALKSLIAKGLIQSRPKIGSRVEPRVRWNLLDRDVLDWHHAAMDRMTFMQSTQEARRLIEPGIAAMAARKHQPMQAKRLVAAMAAMERAKSDAEFNAADVEFHEALLSAANNDLLMPFSIVIEKALSTLFEFTTPRNPHRALVIKMHGKIAAAVVAGNERAADRAMCILLDDTDAVVAARRTRRGKQG